MSVFPPLHCSLWHSCTSLPLGCRPSPIDYAEAVEAILASSCRASWLRPSIYSRMVRSVR